VVNRRKKQAKDIKKRREDKLQPKERRERQCRTCGCPFSIKAKFVFFVTALYITLHN